MSSGNWQIKHNVLHHSFTNIHGVDEDIEAPEWLLRFDPHTKLYKIHRYQQWYAPLLYALLTAQWVLVNDYFSFFRHRQNPALKIPEKGKWKEFSIMVAFKLAYVTTMFVVPMLVLDLPWWYTIIGFLIMHAVAGTALAHIFQLAHVVERVKIPDVPETGTMKNSWAIHQLKTTVNFAQQSAVMRWFTGGLTNQVEHHLFPTISHVHYGAIAKIVKKTAEDFHLPYFQNETFWKGIRSHYRLLGRLGREREIHDLAFDH